MILHFYISNLRKKLLNVLRMIIWKQDTDTVTLVTLAQLFTHWSPLRQFRIDTLRLAAGLQPLIQSD